MSRKPVYVLGTGLSHDGSACLLKEGRIHVAIEKERITRKKHDGFNDTEAINYCLKHAGISITDLTLVVQNANFENFKSGNHHFHGPRLFTRDLPVRVVTISHHLAHAYSTIGTCPFDEFNVLIIDGCGNSYNDCCDLEGAEIPDQHLIRQSGGGIHFEKDSYYSFNRSGLETLYKDFSEFNRCPQNRPIQLPTTKHSIGGVYQAASNYCFGNTSDLGKLMGLAPYGRPGRFKEEIFELKEGRVFVNSGWIERFQNPARCYDDFVKHFQEYADIAQWVQKEIERATIYIVQARQRLQQSENLCFAGGVALNAVANAKILNECDIKNLYIEPAAGDNGLSIGCAYYGWLELLQHERIRHNGSTFFGASYSQNQITSAIEAYDQAIQFWFEEVGELQLNAHSFTHRACLQFQIGSPLEIYQLTASVDGFENKRRLHPTPDCIIEISKKAFLQLVFHPDIRNEILHSIDLKITDDQLFNCFCNSLLNPR